jgi:hypothetical protein
LRKVTQKAGEEEKENIKATTQWFRIRGREKAKKKELDDFTKD